MTTALWISSSAYKPTIVARDVDNLYGAQSSAAMKRGSQLGARTYHSFALTFK